MAEQYSVKDYNAFTQGISTTNKYSEDLSSKLEEANTLTSSLNDNSIFMGPACDECINMNENIKTGLTTAINNFQDVSNKIDKTAANYQGADNTATKTITDVKTSTR